MRRPTPSALLTRSTQVNGLVVHELLSVNARGRPPVVCIHGLGVSVRHLLPALVGLARDHEVHAPDLPGFGRTGKPKRPLGVVDLARFLDAWMNRVGITRAAVLGNSLGCQVAVELAVLRPERVTKLVLVGPTVDAAARSVSRQLGRLLLDSLREPPALNWVAATDYLRAGRAERS